MYDPFSGVTNNQSESFNATLKRLQKWHEVPIDTIILSLYHNQAFYYNEIQRGLAGNEIIITIHIDHSYNICKGLGDYRLLPEFKSARRSMDELNLIKCYDVEDVIKKRIASSKYSMDEPNLIKCYDVEDVIKKRIASSKYYHAL